MAESQNGRRAGSYEGIFLDFYGTVASGDREAVEAVCQEVIDACEIDLSADQLALKWGHAYFDAIEALDGNGFRLLVDIERDTLIETLRPFLGPIDVEPFLRSFHRYMVQPPLFEEVGYVLEQRALPICLVSNADERDLRAAIAHHGLAFDHIVSSESARSYKPAAGIFEAALELTGWSARNVLHVGDSLHSDVGGAQNAGLKTAWVCRKGRISDIGTARPDFTWSDLTPILGL